jgi:hypothetical protein
MTTKRSEIPTPPKDVSVHVYKNRPVKGHAAVRVDLSPEDSIEGQAGAAAILALTRALFELMRREGIDTSELAISIGAKEQ